MRKQRGMFRWKYQDLHLLGPEIVMLGGSFRRRSILCVKKDLIASKTCNILNSLVKSSQVSFSGLLTARQRRGPYRGSGDHNNQILFNVPLADLS